jgi:23S rRNA (cytosine1962-C5)-methyltransferase
MKRDEPVSDARLRCRVTATAETIIRAGHPWVFARSVREQNREGAGGELAVIYDRNDRFLAVGFFDPESPLRIRVLHSGKPVRVDTAWWQARLQRAVEKRASILDENTTACRLINGESDGWPGLVLDRYGDVLVLKLYTAVWLPRLAPDSRDSRPLMSGHQGESRNLGCSEALIEMLQPLQPKTIVLRLSRNVQPIFERGGFKDGQILFGDPLSGPVEFAETGIHFEADVVRGQKTGFFLDQRENRRAVESLARDCDVMNAFSFSGGFSLYAARGGARSVTDLDISPHALAGAQRNFDLNRNQAVISRCRHEAIQANAFDWLGENSGQTFDLIVLDPPRPAAFANQRNSGGRLLLGARGRGRIFRRRAPIGREQPAEVRNHQDHAACAGSSSHVLRSRVSEVHLPEVCVVSAAVARERIFCWCSCQIMRPPIHSAATSIKAPEICSIRSSVREEIRPWPRETP